MTNVPVGPNRVSPAGHDSADVPKEPWRESVAASSRSAGNSFKSADHNRRQKREIPKFKLIAALVVLVVLGALFVFFKPQPSSAASYIDSAKYQAIFFTNGQVYFGKLTSVGSDYYKLTDIFYIQAADSSKNPQETTNSEQSSTPQLVKLGQEIHGPDDAMIINRDQVLFFENLKKDGKVTDAISQYRSQKQ